MTWDRTWIDGPFLIPIFGEPETDPEIGEVRLVVGFRPGYHLNVRRDRMPEAAGPFEISPDPETPFCTYAGDEPGEDGRFAQTAFLRFPDEAEARAALGQ